MADLTELTLAEARDGVRGGTFSAVELAQAHIDAIEGARVLNSFITETPERALAMASESDARVAANDPRPMEGVPIAVKDVFCTNGVHTTAGSHILENFTPPYESSVTQNMWDAGGVLLGKTNLDEFAMGSSNETSFFGPVENPWRAADDGQSRVPGGSSGGSAVAVAANIASGAIGTDTGGSIRQPAAYSGIVGMKPTYGRCSRWGTVAFASSLDQAGPMTRTVKDAAILLGAMAGFDAKDSTSVDITAPKFEAALTGEVKGLKVGIPDEYRLEGMPAEIEALWNHGAEWLRDAGAEIVPVSLPMTQYALPAYYIVASAEASSNLARYDGIRYGLREDADDLTDLYETTRASGFGDEVQRRILIGTYALSAGYYDAYYLKAQKVRTRIAEDFRQAFENVDVLLTPTTPSEAFVVGSKSDDPIAMFLNDVFTVPASLAGLPGISVPAGLAANGLPLGLQILAKPFDEQTLFRTAQVLETAAGVTSRPAPWWKEAGA